MVALWISPHCGWISKFSVEKAKPHRQIDTVDKLIIFGRVPILQILWIGAHYIDKFTLYAKDWIFSARYYVDIWLIENPVCGYFQLFLMSAG